MSTKKYHHGHLREALIDGACQQIKEKGVTALNLSKLAQAIGVSQPALYRHFPNKQALTISVACKGLKQLAEVLKETDEAAERNAFDEIRDFAKAYVEFSLTHPELSRLMFSMKERTTEPVLYEASREAAAPLFRIVEAAKSSNTLRNNDVVQVVRIIWASIHGLAMLLMDQQIPFVLQSPTELSEHIEATARAIHLGLFVVGDRYPA